MTNDSIKKFKKVLGIENEIVGVSFVSKMPSNKQRYQDTACTALARAILAGERVFFGGQKFPQMCAGANYFLGLAKISEAEACSVYVKDEQVFSSERTCHAYLRCLPKFPARLKGKLVFIEPLVARSGYDIVIILASPAQAGRILGLLNHQHYQPVTILPNQPTCLALFAPLVTGQLHCNFIDYYDRYYQGVVGGRKIWSEDKMLISLKQKDFQEVLDNINKSPQGSFQPKLKPQKVDPFPKV